MIVRTLPKSGVVVRYTTFSLGRPRSVRHYVHLGGGMWLKNDGSVSRTVPGYVMIASVSSASVAVGPDYCAEVVGS